LHTHLLKWNHANVGRDDHSEHLALEESFKFPWLNMETSMFMVFCTDAYHRFHPGPSIDSQEAENKSVRYQQDSVIFELMLCSGTVYWLWNICKRDLRLMLCWSSVFVFKNRLEIFFIINSLIYFSSPLPISLTSAL
jgi:hypothetical protein